MRKLTTLLTLLLLCVVGAQAATTYTVSVGPSNGEFYRADGQQLSDRWAARFVSNGEPQVTISTTANKFTVARTGFSTYDNANPLTWTISVQDGYAITGYKIVGTTTEGTATLTPSEGGSAATFTATSGSLEVSGLSTQSTTFTSQRGTSDDVNISFTTYEVYVESTQPTLTYKVMWDGAQVASAEANRVAGAASLPASLQRAFCTYTYNPETITDATEEVIVTATWNGPVAIAPNFAEASWYYIRSNAKDTYLSYEAAATDNVVPNITENDKSEKLWWAFAGNPYDGFTIYNKAAGSDKILGSPYGSTGTKYNKAAHCSMDAPGTRVSEKFYFNEAEGNFCIADASGYEFNFRKSPDDTFLAYYNAYANATDAQANVLVAELAYQFYPAVGIEVNTTNFDYYTSGGSLGNWAATLISKNAPEIRVVVRDNGGNLAGNVHANAAQSATNFVFYSGQNAPSTYTISCPSGYELLSYTLTHNSASDKTVTPTEGIGTIDKQDDGTTVTINVTDINATEASFVYSGTNDGLVGTLTIRYHRVALPAYVTYIVNDEGGNEVARYTDIEVEDGAEISELPAEYRKTFMTYTYGAPVTAVYGTPVTFTATEAGYNLPFTVSTEGNETWYILKAGNYYSYVGNKSTSYSGRNTNYYYAFFGSPETGFTIKNGNGKFINHNTTAWSSPITMSDEGAVFMIEEAEGGFRMRTDHATEPSRILYLGYYSDYTPFTVWTDLKSANDGILHAIPVGITNLESLSNNKKYTLTTERGTLGTDNGALASTIKGFAAGEFAIINFSGSYYLYSVSDQKFVDESGNLVDAPTVSVTFTGNAPFVGKLGNNGINISGGYDAGVIVNSWTTADQGNMYAIEEAGDFDPSAALAVLQTAVYNNLIAELETVNYGTALGQYGLTGDYAGYETQMATILDGLKTAGYSEANLTIVQGLHAATSLNMPKPNTFLYIQSVNGANAYLKAAAAGTRETFTTTKDINTVFLLDAEGKLISYATGIANNNVREAGTVDGAASLFTVVPAVSGNVGQYSLGATFNSSTNYLYSTGVDGSNADRNTLSTSFLQQNSFYLEAVTELPVTISAAGYATFCAPVATTIPAGVKAYIGKASGEHLALTEVEETIPANEPVVLEGAEGTYDFAIVESTETADAANELSGTTAAIAAPANTYTLQQQSGVVGFYPYSGTDLRGFAAYLQNTSGVRGFIFETTGINDILNAGNNGTAYDLQGRRVMNAQKGLYILNGKKVLVK